MPKGREGVSSGHGEKEGAHPSPQPLPVTQNLWETRNKVTSRRFRPKTEARDLLA